jgi:hypothetical protein
MLKSEKWGDLFQVIVLEANSIKQISKVNILFYKEQENNVLCLSVRCELG